MGDRSASDAVPLYRQISAALHAAIAGGEYPVGAVMPTELEIAERFGVSRHTVRDALRILSTAGVIRRRRRIGTVVTGETRKPEFVQPLRGFEELLQYGRNLHLQVDVYGSATGSRLARTLRLDPVDWVRIEGRRGRPARPLGLTTVLVRRDCAPTRQAMAQSELAVSELIERSAGVAAVRIEQEISACALGRREAAALSTPVGSAALRTLRQYYEQNGELFLAAESLHPGERFNYAMSFSRTLDGPEPE